MMNIAGTLVGASITSKLDKDGDPVHSLTLKIYLREGNAKMEHFSDFLRKGISLDIEAVQPSLSQS